MTDQTYWERRRKTINNSITSDKMEQSILEMEELNKKYKQFNKEYETNN